MKVVRTAIPEVLLFDPQVFGDERGFFLERYNKRDFREAIGSDVEFVQDNHSRSACNVLRGLHYQLRQTQGKLVWVVAGEVYDVAVDLRKHSATFGKWVGFTLTAQTKRLAWIPPGFAHGFLVVSDIAEVLYKATDFYAPEHERSLLWSDPAVGVAWPLGKGVEPIVAEKDRRGMLLAEAECFE